MSLMCGFQRDAYNFKNGLIRPKRQPFILWPRLRNTLSGLHPPSLARWSPAGARAGGTSAEIGTLSAARLTGKSTRVFNKITCFKRTSLPRLRRTEMLLVAGGRSKASRVQWTRANKGLLRLSGGHVRRAHVSRASPPVSPGPRPGLVWPPAGRHRVYELREKSLCALLENFSLTNNIPCTDLEISLKFIGV